MPTIIKPIEIVHSAQLQGVNLLVDQGRLAIKKEKGVTVSADLIELIKEHKSELIDFLEKEIQLPSRPGLANIKKIKEADGYRVSNGQHRLWLVSQFEEGISAYNMSNTIVLDGSYNIISFQKAIHAVIERHEILRTVFRLDETGQVKQHILTVDQLKFSINAEDFRGNENPEKAARAYILADAFKPFDLAKGPLLRASLLRMSDDRYLFYYNMHHIVGDEWSTKVLARDVMKYYEAFVSGGVPDMPPLQIQYKDYAAWQLDQLSTASYQEHKNYWLSQFSGEVALINLPTEKKRPQIKTYNGRSIGARLSLAATSQLRNFALEREGSLFLGLLAIWKVLLYRYTGETDLTVGIPLSGRGHADLENQIGFYVNTLALRDKIIPQDSFADFFNQIKENTLEAYKHQMYPFDKILEELSIQRDPGRSLLFDLMFNYHGADGSGKGLNFDNGKELQDNGSCMIKFDLEFDAAEVDGGVDLIMSYNADVYEQKMVEGLLVHYKKLVENVLANPEIGLSEVDFLTASDREILKGYNNTFVTYPRDKTVIDLLEEQVEKTPDKVAVFDTQNSYTYQELKQKSDSISSCLIQEVGNEKEPIGVVLERSAELLIILLGILKSGKSYIPIDPGLPKDRIDYIIENSNTRVIISNQFIVQEGLSDRNVKLIDSKDLLIARQTTEETAKPLPTDTAYIIYTSGSTGKPKGVEIGHQSLTNFLWSIQTTPGISEEDILYAVTTYSFDISILEFFTPLISGSSVFIATDKVLSNPNLIIEDLERVKPTVIQATPSFYQMLFYAGWKGSKDIKALCGGDALNEALAEQLIERTQQVWNMYGPTETTIWSTIKKIEKPHQASNIGQPINNTQIYILDNKLNIVPQGVKGKIFIGGDGLAKGYFKKETLTKERFIQNPYALGENRLSNKARIYNTGDIGKWLSDGSIEFLGRDDYQVKIRGHRIELGEIESVINKIPNIKISAVIAWGDNLETKKLVAYIVCGTELEHSVIQKSLEEKLPDYMVPRIYVSLDEMPLTHNGKINRKALPVPTDEDYNKQEYVAPETDEEKVLASAWESLLMIEKISVKDNFYNLGGGSIETIRLIHDLKKKGYTIEVRQAIMNPVLEDMARVIKKDHIQERQVSNESTENLSLVWSVGDLLPVSENQKYFIRRPWDMIRSHTISLSNFSEDTFELKFRNLLKNYHPLMVKFEKGKEKEDVFQIPLSSHQFPIDIKVLRKINPNDFTKIYAEADVFLRKPFNYFNETPLVRIFLVIDPTDANKAFLSFCMAHALVDIDTFKSISNNLEHAFDHPKIQEHASSNMALATWQKNFLNSEKGKTQRSWWLNYLKTLPLINNKIKEQTEPVDFVIQEKIISGAEYETTIKALADSLNLPVAVIILTAFQYLLNKLGATVQMIAVNGKEEVLEGIDVNNLLGVTTNFLPLKIISPDNQPLQKYIFDVFEHYLNVRLYQKVPYEVIRKDFKETVDLDKVIMGYFNFINLDKTKLIEQDSSRKEILVSYIKTPWQDVYGTGLICGLYKNGIVLKLMCSKELYENEKLDVFLDSFINKFKL